MSPSCRKLLRPCLVVIAYFGRAWKIGLGYFEVLRKFGIFLSDSRAGDGVLGRCLRTRGLEHRRALGRISAQVGMLGMPSEVLLKGKTHISEVEVVSETQSKHQCEMARDFIRLSGQQLTGRYQEEATSPIIDMMRIARMIVL